MKKLAFLKKFVSDHKVAIAVGVTSAVFIALMLRNARVLNAFLDEHNLTDVYYSLED
jgi:hypothetical protein